MEKKHNIVYKIINRVNKNSYIGVHKTDNLADGYMGSGVVIRRAIAKYGIENFNKEILFDFSTYKEALKKEAEIVDNDFLMRSDTYNLRRGGTGGFDYINKHRLQNTQKNTEKRKERLPNMLKAYKERMKDPKFREIIVEAGRKGYEQMKLTHPDGNWLGKKHTAETKAKISRSKKGKQTVSTLGKHWFTNDEKNILAFYCPDGYHKGRTCAGLGKRSKQPDCKSGDFGLPRFES